MCNERGKRKRMQHNIPNPSKTVKLDVTTKRKTNALDIYTHPVSYSKT